MRPKADFTAIQRIPYNGVTAYQPGDDVPASAVENLSLVIGVQVKPAHGDVIPRPAGNAARAEWERYAIGQGMDASDAGDMTRDELRAHYPEQTVPDVNPSPVGDVVAEQATQQTNEMEPPGSHGSKAEWIAYAVERGMPQDVAEDSTIEELARFDFDTVYGR